MEILDGIGSTEILHIFISNRPGQAQAGQHRPDRRRVTRPGSSTTTAATAGAHVGTLLIKGDSIAAGYWNKHEQTKHTFCGEWINTHDKFLVDEDGFFWYAGRTDDMIKVSGQAVWPTDVEAVLQQHPAVLESGVVGTADADGLIKPVAYVVLKDGRPRRPNWPASCRSSSRSTAAPHKYPRAVVFVETCPRRPPARSNVSSCASGPPPNSAARPEG